MSELSGLIDKPINASGSLSFVDVQHLGRFVIGTAGVVAKLAAPDAYLSTNRFKTVVANDSSGLAFLFSKDGFSMDRDLIWIPPGGEVHLEAGFLSDQTTRCWKVKADYLAKRTWNEYTATLAFTTATPTVTKLTRYQLGYGICAISGKISTADGAGATALTVSLPEGILPYNVSARIPFVGWKSIDGVLTQALGFVDCQSTAANKLLWFPADTFGPWTDNKACWLEFTCWFPVDGSFTSFTPTVNQTDGPATLTKSGGFKVTPDGLCYLFCSNTTADGAGTSAATVDMPISMRDWNSYVAVAGLQSVDGVYSDMKAYIDALDNTETNRKIKLDNFAAWTDDKAITFDIAAVFPVFGESTWTPEYSWPSVATTPGSLVSVGKYLIDTLLDQCWISLYDSSADGNGGSSCSIKPPVPPRQAARDIRLMCHKKVNTTWSDPGAKLVCNEDDPDDRLIEYDDYGTNTNAQAYAQRLCGVYEI